MNIDFDASDLARLADHLGRVPDAVEKEARAIVAKGALNIKNEWRRRWSGHPHAPSLPSAVTYDTTVGAGRIEAEIGPDKSKRQGALGNIYEFGTPNNPPIPGGAPAADKERPNFERYAEKLVVDALEQR